MKRRNVLGASLAAVTAAAASPLAAATTQPVAADADAPQAQKGFGYTPRPASNPLEAKIVAFTTVSADVDASIRFYRDVIGMTLAENATLPADISNAPGIGKAGRRHAVLTMGNGAAVRVLQAPANARANRPRPGSGPNDPGLFAMESPTRDAAESYHKLASANTPMVSPPRYYFHHEGGRDLDIMTYSPFGPGGEQMLLTANVRSDRPEWTATGLHEGFNNTAVTTIDYRPADAFYDKALGLKRPGQGLMHQKNCNQLIGASDDSAFLWGAVGFRVSIEVWEFRAASGTLYPTALDRTGLAMLTIRVNNIAKCREMCKAAGIKPVGEGALPLPGPSHRDGFYLRGAVGELIEVVPV